MLKSWRPLYALLTLVLSPTMLFVGSASATTVAEMDLPEMAKLSGAIVHGTVVSTSSRWNEDRTLIYTDVRVQVLDTLKGNAAGEIVITQPGGTVGKLRVDVPGAAAYRAGQEMVLFLAPTPEGRYQVAGLSRGKFDVREDPKTGRKEVMGFSEVHVEEGAAGMSAAVASETAKGEPVELEEFLGQVNVNLTLLLR